ncbi:MAG: hypothetical protein QE263_07275 [Vampirovibrionales bacterium]|nr:hypothetical protein [Vampirovibrionales bacterium]
MLEIIDYGGGNLGSMTRCLERLDIPYKRVGGSGRSSVSAQPSGNYPLLFPGVGAFGAAMQHLHDRALTDRIRGLVNDGVPYLGVCIGLQVLFESSEEAPDVPGLGLLPGVIKHYRRGKVPQIGWNALKEGPIKLNSALTTNDPLNKASTEENLATLSPLEAKRQALRVFVAQQGESATAYFVNSYYPVPDAPELTLFTADYYGDFCAAAQLIDSQRNITAFQFHPEKSGPFGHQLIQEWMTHVV